MSPPARPRPATGAPEGLTVRVTARASALAAVRQQLRAWLDAVGWPVAEQSAVLLTTSEACSNAAQHAYLQRPVGKVEVRAHVAVGDAVRRVVVVVRDEGTWRAPTPGTQLRGHGLKLMRACTHACDIDRTVHGTAVTLTSRAVPRGAGRRPSRVADAGADRVDVLGHRYAELVEHAHAATWRAHAAGHRAAALARRSEQLVAASRLLLPSPPPGG